MQMEDVVLFSGSSNPQLSKKLAQILQLQLGKLELGQFADGETKVQLGENVRGKSVVIVQSLSQPANDHLLELVLIADAAKRSSAQDVFAVIPYLGYSRQDRRPRSARVPISARVIADFICNSGINRILTIDLHSEQVQGFYNIPVDNIYSSSLFSAELAHFGYASDNLALVSPDVGGVVRARALAMLSESGLVIVDKRRPHANVAEVMNVIGDVKDKVCVLVDDIIDTAGTLCNTAAALKEKGAKEVHAMITHAVLSGNAVNNIEASNLKSVIVTDTIALREKAVNCAKISVLSAGSLLAESITRVQMHESLSLLFD